MGVNCGSRSSLNCFHQSITEERLKIWRRKKNINIHTGVTSINISHKVSWDRWSLLQDNSGAHWQARLGILRNGTQAPATEKKLRLRPVELSPLELALNEVCCFTLHRCTYHLSFKVVICEKWLKFSPKISRKDGLA